MIHRQHKWLYAVFVIALIASIAYNGFASNLWMAATTSSSVKSSFSFDPSLQRRVNTSAATVLIPPRLKKDTTLLLGISCSEEEKEAILETYLSNNSLHSFPDACLFDDYHDQTQQPTTATTSHCQVRYKFWPPDTPIQTWLQFANTNTSLLAEHINNNNNNPMVVWVPSGRTIIYPPYFTEYLTSVLLGSSDNKEMLFVGDTPRINCNTVAKGKRKRIDGLACRKLSGELSVISLQALNQVLQICQGTVDTTSAATSLKELFEPCSDRLPTSLKVSSPSSSPLPRQFEKPDVEGFRFFWNRLVEWNSFPFRVEYITAKFGRDGKWIEEVDLAHTFLLANGYHPRQIHAYSEFPEFIRNDGVRWKEHLEFLHNTSLKPKGGGYWFWKAPLILHQLQRVEIGDIVVYADADLPDHCKWLPGLFDRMVETETSLALYAVDYKDQNYTKRDVYSYYCGNDQDQSKDSRLQYAAGLLVVRKTAGVVRLLEQWQEGMQNFTMLNDSPSALPNHAGFQYHLHDQSILSVLVKCRYNDAYKKRLIFDGAVSLTDWTVDLFQI